MFACAILFGTVLSSLSIHVLVVSQNSYEVSFIFNTLEEFLEHWDYLVFEFWEIAPLKSSRPGAFSGLVIIFLFFFLWKLVCLICLSLIGSTLVNIVFLWNYTFHLDFNFICIEQQKEILYYFLTYSCFNRHYPLYYSRLYICNFYVFIN